MAKRDVLHDPIVQDIATLKQHSGKEIVATGSITLVRALVEADLVDAYRLFVYPVVLGHGRRLFPAGVRARLRLVDARTFRSGVALLRIGWRADDVLAAAYHVMAA